MQLPMRARQESEEDIEERLSAIVRLIQKCVHERRYGELVIKWQGGVPEQTLFRRSAKSEKEIDNL